MTMEQTSISFDKACIFGAGAIGGWMGAALARAGCQLSAVARGAALQARKPDPAAQQGGSAVWSRQVGAGTPQRGAITWAADSMSSVTATPLVRLPGRTIRLKSGMS